MVKSKHLVIAGAGHAHMQTLQRLSMFCSKGHRVTVIGPDEYHYYSGMGPGVLGGTYRLDQIRFHSRRIVEAGGGTFLCDRVCTVDGEKSRVILQSGKILDYDVLSLNLGSVVNNRLVSDGSCQVYPVKPINNLESARQHILLQQRDVPFRVVIVGGGNSAAEIAGNCSQLFKENNFSMANLQVICRSTFLSHSPEKLQNKVKRRLLDRGVSFLENDAALKVDQGKVVTVSGREVAADLIFAAQGIVPSPLIRQSALPLGKTGGLLVNSMLQCTGFPNIFGGGDCVDFAEAPLDKVGVYAVRQNPVLSHNLAASLSGDPLIKFQPHRRYLLILNLGLRYGVMTRGGMLWSGLIPFLLKDVIDRRFIARFSC